MPEAGSVPRLTEHLFRQEAGKLVSVLTGIFGIDRLQLAEDVVQEALVRALQTWPYYGIPKNPAGWLMQTARNLALDVVRREKVFRDKQPAIIATIDAAGGAGEDEEQMFDDEIKDGRLRLIFACCHPQIPLEAQTALALKTLCGFSPAEIARAFLVTEAAIAKRLTRARQRIQELRIAFEIPSGDELCRRLDGVLQILYLLFNEGYKASSGESLVRADLCYEAMRLTDALVEHPVTNLPRTRALLALMCLDAARLPARTDAAGNMQRLHAQDRDRWDRALITRGIRRLSEAAVGDALSEYHLQAGIAACHCAARSYADTDWLAILGLYDQWLALNPSPLIALNRAVALAAVRGPQAGIAAVDAISDRKTLDGYYLTHAVLGDFEARAGNPVKATAHFQRALELTAVESERALLGLRLAELA